MGILLALGILFGVFILGCAADKCYHQSLKNREKEHLYSHGNEWYNG
jgi:hypothetical protein